MSFIASPTKTTFYPFIDQKICYCGQCMYNPTYGRIFNFEKENGIEYEKQPEYRQHLRQEGNDYIWEFYVESYFVDRLKAQILNGFLVANSEKEYPDYLIPSCSTTKKFEKKIRLPYNNYDNRITVQYGNLNESVDNYTAIRIIVTKNNKAKSRKRAKTIARQFISRVVRSVAEHVEQHIEKATEGSKDASKDIINESDVSSLVTRFFTINVVDMRNADNPFNTSYDFLYEKYIEWSNNVPFTDPDERTQQQTKQALDRYLAYHGYEVENGVIKGVICNFL